MSRNSFINTLILNIINGNLSMHCRLCLRELADGNDVEFNTFINKESTEDNLKDIRNIINEIFDDEMMDDILALNTVCPSCTKNLVQANNFIKSVKHRNALLSNVLDNTLGYFEKLNIENFNNQKLFIVIDECSTQGYLLSTEEKHKPKMFVCEECDLIINNVKDLKKHFRSYHHKFLCEKCTSLELFDSKNKLNSHLLLVHNIHQYKCPKCSQTRGTEEALMIHIKKYHEKDYICDTCGKVFNSLEKLRVHEDNHNSMQCPKCDKKYQTKAFYDKHVGLCLSGNLDTQPFRSHMKQDFKCGVCGKKYGTAGGLRVHERFTHQNENPHICQYCGKQFTAPSYLKTHLIKHTGEKNFKCNFCKRGFVTKESLVYHKRRHTGEKPYSCKYCDEKFVNSSARAEHIKFKHIGPTLMCEICSQKFVTKSFLKKHLMKHYDPTSKLYERFGPANVPSVENMRILTVSSQ